MSAPIFTLVSSSDWSQEFRVEGGDVDPKWNPRGTPWCRFSIRPGSDFLSSYGGEVWPMAYPEFFRGPELPEGAINRNPSHTFLTEAGLAAVREALSEASHDAWLDALAKECRNCAGCSDVPCGGCQGGGVCDAFACRCGDHDDPSEPLGEFDGLDGGER